MKCNVCNAELAEGQAFCTYCGAKVEPQQPEPEIGATTVLNENPYEAPAAQEAYAEQPADPYEEQPAYQYAEQPAEVAYDYAQPAEYEQPAGYGYTDAAEEEAAQKKANKFALVGMILGIASFLICCLGLPGGIAGIITSAKGMKSKTRKWMGILGLILSILAMIPGIFFAGYLIFCILMAILGAGLSIAGSEMEYAMSILPFLPF